MDSTKKIDPIGDIIVSHPTTTTKLQVSSELLSLASPVFRAMFSPLHRPRVSPLYRGDTAPAPSELLEIQFPDDSLQALEVVFNVVHFRHNRVSKNISSDVLYEIALVTYKYDLMEAVGPWKWVWLSGGAGEGIKGLFVAYVLGGREGLTKACRRVIMQNQGSDVNGNDEGKMQKQGKREAGLDCDMIPEKVVDFISGARISTISSLLSVADHFRKLYKFTIECKIDGRTPISTAGHRRTVYCDLKVLLALIEHLTAIGIHPMIKPPYDGISVESLALAMKGLPSSVSIDKAHGGCDTVAEMAEKVDEVLASVDRLDIWDSAGDTGVDADAWEWWGRGKGSGFVLIDREGDGKAATKYSQT